jgi:hypothetical protein
VHLPPTAYVKQSEQKKSPSGQKKLNKKVTSGKNGDDDRKSKVPDLEPPAVSKPRSSKAPTGSIF